MLSNELKMSEHLRSDDPLDCRISAMWRDAYSAGNMTRETLKKHLVIESDGEHQNGGEKTPEKGSKRNVEKEHDWETKTSYLE